MAASVASSRSGIAPRRQLGGKVVGISLRQWTRTWTLPESRSTSRPFVQRDLPTSEPPVILDRARKGDSLSASPATLRVVTSYVVVGEGDWNLGMRLRTWTRASSDLRQARMIFEGRGVDDEVGFCDIFEEYNCIWWW